MASEDILQCIYLKRQVNLVKSNFLCVHDYLLTVLHADHELSLAREWFQSDQPQISNEAENFPCWFLEPCRAALIEENRELWLFMAWGGSWVRKTQPTSLVVLSPKLSKVRASKNHFNWLWYLSIYLSIRNTWWNQSFSPGCIILKCPNIFRPTMIYPCLRAPFQSHQQQISRLKTFTAGSRNHAELV